MSEAAASEAPAAAAEGVCSIHVALHEHEMVAKTFESWPQAVQNIILRELADWRARNPDRELVSETHGVAVRVCFVEFSHRLKAAQP